MFEMGEVIHINVQESTLASSSANSSGLGKENATQFEELCLIKIYEGTGQVHFSYWTPKNTTKTLASVVFRYWRHFLKNDPRRME
jgi:hypothetical protein